MIGMNGFTLGFFFPKQAFANSSHSTAKLEDEKKTKKESTSGTFDDVDREGQEPSLFLYAYRYF